MRAISIREPWASMIARGEKTVEVRSWYTAHRGELLLCASASPAGPHAGLAFAVAELACCRRFLPADAAAARCGWEDELYAWELRNVTTLRRPFRVRGQLRFFEVPVARDQIQ